MNTKSNLLKSIFISLILLMGVNNAWANGGIGYKGVKFTKNDAVTGWYNIHNVDWGYAHSSYECRSGKTGVTNFSNADLGIVTSLKLHSFVVIGWTNSGSDYVAGQLKHRLYKQSASAGSYSTYNVGNYGNNSWGAYDVLIQDGDNRVVGKNGDMNITLVDNNTAPGQYFLQLHGLGRMQWTNNNGSSGSFSDYNGSEVKAQLVVPGFTTTSKSQPFDNTQVNNSSSKTISFGTHYGTALKTSNCSISGTNASEFSVTSINESGVTVQFKPTSAGDKNATLTITDEHNKTCTITLSGEAIASTYTVTFGVHSSGHGSLIAKVGNTSISTGAKVNQGSSITFTAGASTGYEVAGWYSNSDCTTAIAGAGTSTTYTINSLTAATTVYARFTKNATNSLTVVAGEGIASVTGSTDPVTLGNTYDITATLETGYTFSTWTAEPEENATFGSATTANTTVTVKNGAVTVTASATEKLHNVTVYYKCGDETITDNTAHDVGEVTSQSITATTIDGYVFSSWTLGDGLASANTSANPISVTTKASGNYTLTANYTAKPYYIGGRFQQKWNDGSSTTNPFTYAGNGRYKLETRKTVAELSAQITESYGNRDQFFFIHTGKGKAGTSTYPFWTTKNGDNSGHNFEAHIGESNAIELGCQKTNWNSIDENRLMKFTDATDKSSDVVIWWEPSTNKLWYTAQKNYKITYGVGNNKGTEAVTTSPSITSGSLVLPSTSITFSKGDTKAGYTWKNWNNKADGTGTNLGEGDTYVSSNRTGDISVYACYDLISYTITYNINDGTNPNDAPTSYNVTTATFNLPTPSKTGYTFAGWYTTSDFSDTEVTQITKGSTGDKIFYAQWTANTYTITWDANGGTVDPTTSTYTYDGDPVALPTPKREGYTFNGWYTEKTDGKRIDNIGKGNNPTSNVTYYAQWTANTYTVTLDQTGATTQGTSSVTATYDADMPSATMPTKTGYVFGGYYDQQKGQGTQYYKADGTSARTWNKADKTTLYAYFVTPQIEVTLNGSTFEPGTASVTATATVTPAPANGTTSICWSLLYSGSENKVAGHEPEPTNGNSVQFSISDLAAGSYTIKAILREGTGCEGTEISSATQTFRVASNYTVTVKYMCGDQIIKTSTTVPGHATDPKTLTADDIFGYTFSAWEAGDGVEIKTTSQDKKTITYTAIYDGYLTAKYTKDNNIIYFNNVNLKWNDVYVYFYKGDFWNDTQGTGAIDSDGNGSYEGYVQMTKIEGTNIWYAKNTYNDISQVAFSPSDQNGKQYFNCAEAVRCWSFDTRLPMYVPIKAHGEKKNNTTTYYNKGYWMNYPENTGYTLRLYSKVEGDGTMDLASIPFEYSENKDMPMSIEVELGANQTYGFKIYSADDKWRGNNSIMTSNSTNWEMSTDTKNCGLTTTIAGKYTFVINYINTKNTDYNYSISVKFPGEEGDYRVIYTDNGTTNWSGANRGTGWYHPSRLIQKKDVDTKETISFFVNHDKEPKLQIQKATIKNGGIKWENIGEEIRVDINEDKVYNFTFRHAEDNLEYIGNIEPYTGNYYVRSYALDGKWNNYLIDNDNRMTYSAFSESKANSFGDKYSHYVTKFCEKGTNIKFTIANDYSPCITDTLIKDIKVNGNNPFDNLDNDGTIKNDDKYKANVRFMWNRTTNRISRAYIGPAGDEVANRQFLILKAEKEIKNSTGGTLSNNGDNPSERQAIFSDTQNWIYERTIQVQPETRVKLYACYPEVDPVNAQYFRGAHDENTWTTTNSVKILGGGEGSSWNTIRVIYDFKTNRLMAAWMPSGEINEEKSIEADMMILRRHQEDAQCVTFNNDNSKLTNIKTVYGVMRFNRWILNNRANPDDLNIEHCTRKDGNQTVYDEKTTDTYHPVLSLNEQAPTNERGNYFISFPFEVHLSDVFGFGQYGTHWIISNYNGLRRAERGFFIDNCVNEDCTNWDYIWDPDDFVLEANKGYLLSLDLDLMKHDNTSFWAHNTGQMELFFPSTANVSTIEKTNYLMDGLSDDYICKINYNKDGNNPEGDRRVKDTYWRCIGVPSFADYDGSLYKTKEDAENEENAINWKDNYTWQADYSGFPFLYEWNTADNSITPVSTQKYTFRPTFAYLVQNGNPIYWSAVNTKPSNIVARRQAASEINNYEWKLTLSRNEQIEDQAFVRLSDNEKVTTEFDFNQDLSKEFNYGRSDIYTLIGYEKAAANSLPLSEQTTLIPLGLSIEYNGDYTIAMPDGTANIGVTLVDNQTGTRTNLSAGMEYTLTLNKGDYNNRFFIEISPIQQTPTDIEYVTGDSNSQNSVRKVLIDNILYIVRDGQIFDARGARVK